MIFVTWKKQIIRYNKSFNIFIVDDPRDHITDNSIIVFQDIKFKFVGISKKSPVKSFPVSFKNEIIEETGIIPKIIPVIG